MHTLLREWDEFWTPVTIQPGTGRWHRGWIKQKLERTHRTLLIWECGMAVATVAYIALYFASDAKELRVLEILLWGFSILFVTEFVVRLSNAPDRKEYLFRHWMDAVSAIPPIGFFRSYRLLRLVRLLGMMRLIAAIDLAMGHRKGKRTSFWFLCPLLLIVWVGSATALWLVEYPENTHMHTFFDALYMAFGAVTTFGYAVNPATPEGHVITGLLILVGFGLVTYASGHLTTKLLRERDPMDKVSARLSRIEQSLEELKALRVPAAEQSLGDRPAA
jgi:voltage-gated potassium channel